MKRKVISSKNDRVNIPTIPTAVATLCLYVFKAPMWLWGATGAIFLLIWIAWIVGLTQQEQVDIFKDKK